ncbi:MAG: carboxypeptidase [Maribacter sp.]|nr:MAG: carboxypeptidase [Maribacter sp.]
MKRALLAFLLVGTMAIAQKANDTVPKAGISKTMQSVNINGETIYLTAQAGTFEVRDENNEPIALMGHTYYTKGKDKRSPGSRKRPIVFAYNGGPGSSSFWLHMGALGPKRIVTNDPVATPAAPYKIINNDYSILDVADLVMIDPVGTGLSTPVGKAKFKDFWGVDQDIRSLSLFITQFLIAHDRMNSPKYLLGESYGTFRNAGVMNKLLGQGIAMNGVIMVSAVFDLRTLLFPPNDDLPYIVHLPTYAATAWYHDKVADKPADVYQFLDEIRSFTENEYTPALFKGNQLPLDEKQEIASKLATYTGTSEAFWLKAELRVTASEFFAEFLRDKGEIVGRLDSRFTGINQDLLAQEGSHDPQSTAISPAYITGFLDYLHRTLKVDKNLTYTITASRRKGFKWDWSHVGNNRWGTQAAINTGIDMAEALSKDPNMKVLVLNGIYDLATVFYGVEHSINHLDLTKEAKENIIMKYYESGHMMYIHEPSLVKFKNDISEFIKATSN